MYLLVILVAVSERRMMGVFKNSLGLARLGNEFVFDRNTIGAINIGLRYLSDRSPMGLR
jgi:hypothetical protein